MSTITVSAADVDLFHVAAAKLGDFTQWWRLLPPGVTDPAIDGIVTLTLPPVNPQLSGGLPNQ